MKRYWIFSGETYYPSGGFDDFKGAFNTLVEAQTVLNDLMADDTDGCTSLYSWGHIVDTQSVHSESGEVVVRIK